MLGRVSRSPAALVPIAPIARAQDWGTILDALVERARADDGRGGYAFLGNGESVSDSLSWAELAQRVCAVSAAVRSCAAPGDRALLLFWPGLDFLVGFLGCLHAGIVAVPCVPPRRPLARSLDRIAPIIRVAAPTLVLASGTPAEIAAELRAFVPDLARCKVLDLSHVEPSEGLSPSSARRDDLAFLQFTSGSTAEPRGVMVTHANLLHNLRYIHAGFEHDASSVSVTWLPVYHDMGLIDGMLSPLLGGFRCVAMAPHAFLQRPVRWLRAISRFRGTHTAGPTSPTTFVWRRSRQPRYKPNWTYPRGGSRTTATEPIRAFHPRRLRASDFGAQASMPERCARVMVSQKATPGKESRASSTSHRTSLILQLWTPLSCSSGDESIDAGGRCRDSAPNDG